jgi:hypothetical protein
MDDPAPIAALLRIGEGIELGQRGEREAARAVFTRTWEDIGGEEGEPFHRCALRHFMADVLDGVHAELVWDLRAVVAADGLTEAGPLKPACAPPWRRSIPRFISTWATAIAGSEMPSELRITWPKVALRPRRCPARATAG